MKKPENVFRAACILKFRKEGAFGNSIETASTGVAIPDQYVTFTAVEDLRMRRCPAWIEYKVMGCKYSPDRLISFRPGQLAWLRNNEDHGGYSFVCVKYTNGVLFVPINKIEGDGYPIKGNGCLLPEFDALRVMQIMARRVAELEGY